MRRIRKRLQRAKRCSWRRYVLSITTRWQLTELRNENNVTSRSAGAQIINAARRIAEFGGPAEVEKLHRVCQAIPWPAQEGYGEMNYIQEAGWGADRGYKRAEGLRLSLECSPCSLWTLPFGCDGIVTRIQRNLNKKNLIQF
jgi:hypothetical protein